MVYDFIDTLAQNYLDDGIITYKANGKRRFVKTVFNYLEDVTGIDFKRVGRRRSAEIDIDFTDEVTGGAAGYALTWSSGRSEVQVDPTTWHWQSTTSHEIAHALGLEHDHFTTQSITSYNRDYSEWRWYAQDFNNLLPAYEPFI